MKKTKEDESFAISFAKALQPHIDRELDAGQSMAKIAAKLGVTAWGLQKQLNGGTPSIRTVALAYAEYKIAVAYAGIDITRVLSVRRKTRKNSEQQLSLPFEITAPSRVQNMTLKMSPQGVRKYKFEISMRVGS
jgi:hypothetical protein